MYKFLLIIEELKEMAENGHARQNQKMHSFTDGG